MAVKPLYWESHCIYLAEFVLDFVVVVTFSNLLFCHHFYHDNNRMYLV